MRELPVWRSLLYVPVTVDRFVEKAHTRGADAIILDLEDSVPPSEKETARARVAQAATKVARGGADVLVRINRPWRLAVRDLEACVIPGIRALLLPKVEHAEHVRALEEVVDELEAERGIAPGSVGFVVVVETPRGFFRMEEVARASSRVVALMLGAEDFAWSTGMVPEEQGLFYPKLQVVLAARSAGVLPLGFVGTVADYSDLDTFRQVVRRSRKLGFTGATAVHPSQIPILNEEFSPSPEEVQQAQRIVSEYEAALARGVGAIAVEGRMVDIPVYRRALDVLRRHEQVVARSQRPGEQDPRVG